MTSAREAQTWAAAYDKKLLATDGRFRRSVVLVHEEGSTLHFRYAFLVRVDDFLFCFAEHHGYHFYHVEDLSFWAQYEPVPVEDVNPLETS